MTLTTLATYDCAPGDREEVLRLLDPARAATEAEEGCVYFHTLLPLGQPDRIVLIEGWRSEQDLSAHRGTAHFIEIILGAVAPRLLDRDVTLCSDALSPAAVAGSEWSSPRRP